MNIIPYLFSNGQCEEAAHFYAAALRGEVGLVYRKGTYISSKKGSHELQHANVTVKGRIVLQIANITVKTTQTGFAISLPAQSVEEATRLFDAIAIGGTITVPFSTMLYSPNFGMLVDKFGVSWVISSVS